MVKTEPTDVIDIIETTEDEMKKQDDHNKTGLISVNGVEIHGDGKASLKHRAIAAFVYYIEAFEYSQCEKTDKERAVSIGEYDILAVERDDSDIGYKFSVRPCKLKSYDVESTSNKNLILFNGLIKNTLRSVFFTCKRSFWYV